MTKGYLGTVISTVRTSTDNLQASLETANAKKDRLVFDAIKSWWPAQVTPNHLTLVRIIIGAWLFFLLFNFKNDTSLLILPLFCLGALTDLLDGVIARGFNKITKFGEITDPIADRILLMPIMFYSLVSYNRPLFFVIILSEIINGIISLITMGKKMPLGSNIFGKTKMFIQSVAFIAILVVWPRNPGTFFMGLLWLSLIFMAISIIFKGMQILVYYETKYAHYLQYPFRQKRTAKTIKGQKA